MARKRYQSGQLTDLGDRWCARWREDVVTAKGIQRVRKKETWTKQEVRTEKEAKRKLAKILDHINSEDYKPFNQASSLRITSFASFAQRFIEDIQVLSKPSTRHSEGSRVKHLVSCFGLMDLKDIRAEVVQRWVSQHKLSPNSLRKVVVTFKAMWKYAETWGYAEHDPFRNLKLPKGTKPKAYTFSIEEAHQIMDKAKGRWKILFRTLAETGMRPGELAGVRVEDVGPRSLSVRQSIWDGHVQTPKTEDSIRTCAISEGLAEELKTLIQDPIVKVAGLLFPGSDGQPLNMSEFHKKVVKPILIELGIYAKVKAMGFRGVGNYAFRHFNATQMATMRVPLATIQKRIGHGLGSEVTHKHYIESVSADEQAAADALGELLTPRQEGETLQ